MTLASDARSRDPVGGPGGGSDVRGAHGVPGRGDGPGPVPIALLLAGVVALGVAFRFVTRSDLWLDEALSVNIARVPWGDLRHALQQDGAPPLYYALLHLWSDVFGTSDVAVRALSGVLSVATIVLAWFAGRRVGGRRTAWLAVLVVALNPYAIRYATETRMYSLLMLLVFAGILAFRRTYERPDLGRLAVLALVVAAIAYTQYWGLDLLAVAFAFLVVLAWRGDRPAAARRMLGAFVVAGLAFLPWLPTFLYQQAHTGTPWGDPELPAAPIGKTIIDFSGSTEHEGWLLVYLMTALLVLGVFGRALDRRHIELDLRTQPGARWEAAVGGVTLVVATSVAYLAGSAFQTRYTSIVFPFFVLVVARGLDCLVSRPVLAATLAAVIALGIVGAGRNVVRNRTQAGKVVDVIAAGARPGDVVLYCPDQVGVASNRLLARTAVADEVREMAYPSLDRSVRRIDWVDYAAVLRATDPAEVAERVAARTGDHTIWFVWSPTYRTHQGTCELLRARLVELGWVRTTRVQADVRTYYEDIGLEQLSPS